MIYLVPIVAWLLFIFAPMDTITALGVTSDRLVNAGCYPAAHASWLHLVINTISLCLLWFPIRKLYTLRYNCDTSILSVATYIAAVIAGLACATTVPTVGMSGMVFFLLGVLLLLNPTKKQALNYLWIVATLAVQLYFGHSNVSLHIFAFVEGCIYICIREFLYQYKARLNA